MRALWLLAVGLLLIGCLNPPASEASGEEIYLQLCARCHGEELEGGLGPAMGAGTVSAEQPDEFIAVSVTRGRGRMPALEGLLTDQQLDRLIEYIRHRQEGR